MNNTTSFILKPIFGDLNEKGLKIQDILIYIAIRSFKTSNHKCYPRYTDISEISGCSTKVIRNGIKRLQSAGFLKVFKIEKSKHKFAYTFNDDLQFQLIPDDIFFAEDLSVKEKATLLVINEHNEEGFAGVGVEIAENADLPLKTFKKCYEKLKSECYLFEDIDYCDIDNVFLPFIFLWSDRINLGSGEIFDIYNIPECDFEIK